MSSAGRAMLIGDPVFHAPTGRVGKVAEVGALEGKPAVLVALAESVPYLLLACPACLVLLDREPAVRFHSEPRTLWLRPPRVVPLRVVFRT